MGLLIFYFLFALTFSFICSVMESTLFSTPLSFINMKDAEGSKSAKKLKHFKENIDKPLSAILTVNTIANTVGAAGVGAQVMDIFDKMSFAIASAILTVVLLIGAEIIPKTIGAKYWRKIALRIVPLIQATIFITYPFVVLAELVTRLIGKNNDTAAVSREEVSAMVEMAAEEGEFEQAENKIIQNMMKLESVRVKDVMTPQAVVSMAPEEMTVAAFYEKKDYLH